MKRLLFLLFTALLFVSCSQDENITESPGNNGNDSIAVTFKIGTPFSVEVGDLKSTSLDDGQPLYFRYLVYDRNGNLYRDQLGNFTFYRNQGFNIDDILMFGQYYIAIIASDDQYELESFVPQNYFADIYKKESEISKIYYETFEYDTRENYRNVTLLPIFSEIIIDLVRSNDNMAELEYIRNVDFFLNHLGDAFNISTKKTVSLTSRVIGFGGENQFFSYATTCFVPEDGTEMYLKVNFFGEDGQEVYNPMLSSFFAKSGQRIFIKGDMTQFLNFNIQIDDELEDIYYPLKPAY